MAILQYLRYLSYPVHRKRTKPYISVTIKRNQLNKKVQYHLFSSPHFEVRSNMQSGQLGAGLKTWLYLRSVGQTAPR